MTSTVASTAPALILQTVVSSPVAKSYCCRSSVVHSGADDAQTPSMLKVGRQCVRPTGQGFDAVRRVQAGEAGNHRRAGQVRKRGEADAEDAVRQVRGQRARRTALDRVGAERR